jgi:alpha-tubulin suppressor-like RCC1 family protein
LTTSGGVKCWGWNNYGQLGNNSTIDSHVPVDVSGLTSGMSAIKAGNDHTCALTTGGGVKCWGYNGYGQLGNNSTTNSHVPVDVSGLTGSVSAISAGDYHTCALTTGGSLKCWGDNKYGQLGNNSTTESHVPVDVSILSGSVSAISAGDYHTCALTTGSGLKCWGWNGNGQLGNSSTTDSYVPVDVSGLTSGVSAIGAGGSHTCAVTTGGGVKCWGENLNGQLGNNSTTDSSVPVAVSGLTSGVSAIAAGRYHTCALTSSGGVKCWGDNEAGQLGNNSTDDSYVPVDVSGLTSGVSAISAGYLHTCAITTTGGVKCWGENSDGRLGNNSTATSLVPVDVYNLTSGVSAISAGYYHTCAVTTGGGVKCWGGNSNGQLGNSSTTDSHIPVDVSSLTGGASAISAGGGHTCALTTGGGVKCWGYNAFGQLGNSLTTDSHVPVDVSGLASGINAISVGYGHTCALTTGGTVKCWGLNGNGQLGNNSTTTSHTYVQVSNLEASAYTTASLSQTAPIFVGQSTRFTASVKGAVNTPGGTIQFTIDGINFGSPVTLTSGSAASANTSTLALGVHVIQAVYSGDANYQAGISAGILQVVINAVTPPLVSPVSGAKVPTFRPTFKWLAVTGITKYQIEVSKYASLAMPLVNATVTTLSYTPTINLPASTKLYWSVRTVKSNGTTGAWTTPYYSFTIGLTAPTLTTPANKAISIAHKPTFKWQAVSGATSYTIEVSTSSTFGTMAINVKVSGKTYVPTITLLGNKVYYWRVMATGAVGSSPWSSVFHFSTAP